MCAASFISRSSSVCTSSKGCLFIWLYILIIVIQSCFFGCCWFLVTVAVVVIKDLVWVLREIMALICRHINAFKNCYWSCFAISAPHLEFRQVFVLFHESLVRHDDVAFEPEAWLADVHTSTSVVTFFKCIFMLMWNAEHSINVHF